MPLTAIYIIAGIATLVLTALLFIFVLPTKKDGHQKNKFFQWLYDLFHFKKLYIEAILRFLYILATVGCICFGFFLLFGADNQVLITGVVNPNFTFWTGLVLLIAGPVLLRLVYELFMMAIIVVRNVIEINNSLNHKKEQLNLEPEETINDIVSDTAETAAKKVSQMVNKVAVNIVNATSEQTEQTKNTPTEAAQPVSEEKASSETENTSPEASEG